MRVRRILIEGTRPQYGWLRQEGERGLTPGHRAAVGVAAARRPIEAPAVGAVPEGEVEHPEGVGLPGEAVGGQAPEGVEADAPGAHHEGLDAVGVAPRRPVWRAKRLEVGVL